MAKLGNPIIRGFNPDPSICKGRDAYYIATSTFEWYPGVQIHRSDDLENWTLITRPLNEARLLDMTGVPDSCGVWAPCLTYADGLYWLLYTNVRRFDGNFKDTPNYLTTAPDIIGPWSDPIYLNSSGFDPSLFHDDDGRKWVINMVWDHRPNRSFFGGIMLQQYDHEKKALVGEARSIFSGSPHDGTEGPHLYKREGRYYLLCAEGGTGYDHAMTVARADRIDGPYEIDPKRHLITAKDDPDHPIQRSGHGAFVETDDGRLFATYLCCRPLPLPAVERMKTSDMRRSPLGRETGIQEIFFRDGWYHSDLGNGDVRPATQPFGPIAEQIGETDLIYQFAPGDLPMDFQWLRTPHPEHIFSLDQRPGHLRLFGRESIGSTFVHSLVARRQTEFVYEASVMIDYEPDDFQQMAGLVTYYNGHKFHWIYISFDPEIGRFADICTCHGDQGMAVQFPNWENRVPLPDGTVMLSVKTDHARQQFFAGRDEGSLLPVGPVLDASVLSDEAGKGEGANFTGNFVGINAQDLTGQVKHADFCNFRYRTKQT